MQPAYHCIIADDDDGVRTLIMRILARALPGATIVTANNGAEALLFYEQYGADLVITDYEMPRLSGLELVGALRERQVRIPILLISGDSTVAELAYRAGATCFLAKPLPIAQLQQTVRALLA